MITDNNLRSLIEVARERGAVIRTRDDWGAIGAVQIRSGIPGAGPGWMPPTQAAERLREFVGPGPHPAAKPLGEPDIICRRK